MTTAQRDTTSDTEGQHIASRVAAWVLFGCLSGVAVVTFVLSFHGLDDYGQKVAGLGQLSWMVPLGVDGLTITAIAATFLLADAPFRVRLYAWLVFFVANTASVAGNLSHAHARGLTWDGSAGAAAWPVLLTLASHLAIVTRRALVRQMARAEPRPVERQPVTKSVTRPASSARSEPVAPASAPADAPTTTAARQPVTPRPSTPRGPRRPKRDTPEADAQRMWRAGKSHAEIALQLGVSKKTAERLTAPVRQTSDVGGDTADAEEHDRVPELVSAQ